VNEHTMSVISHGKLSFSVKCVSNQGPSACVCVLDCEIFSAM